jgi:hypothetical protein
MKEVYAELLRGDEIDPAEIEYPPFPFPGTA